MDELKKNKNKETSMKDFLANLKTFRKDATIDSVKYLLVPPGTKPKKDGTLGYVCGTYTYPGKKHWRDFRVQIKLIETNNPVLWGTKTPNREQAEELLAFCGSNCGAEMLAKKFGLPKSCAKFSESIIEMIFWKEESKTRFLELFREVKDFKIARKFFGLGLAVDEINDFNLLDGIMNDTEKIDCIRCAKRLQITVKEAIKLAKTMTENGAKIVTPLVSMAFRKHRNLHDMLVDLNEKIEKNGLDAEAKTEVPQKLQAPDGWEFIQTPHRLIYVSKKNGWCTKLKNYWQRMLHGVHFFYHAEKGLAMYSEKGDLLQAKSPRNQRDLSDIMPKKLGEMLCE